MLKEVYRPCDRAPMVPYVLHHASVRNPHIVPSLPSSVRYGGDCGLPGPIGPPLGAETSV